MPSRKKRPVTLPDRQASKAGSQWHRWALPDPSPSDSGSHPPPSHQLHPALLRNSFHLLVTKRNLLVRNHLLARNPMLVRNRRPPQRPCHLFCKVCSFSFSLSPYLGSVRRCRTTAATFGKVRRPSHHRISEFTFRSLKYQRCILPPHGICTRNRRDVGCTESWHAHTLHVCVSTPLDFRWAPVIGDRRTRTDVQMRRFSISCIEHCTCPCWELINRADCSSSHLLSLSPKSGNLEAVRSNASDIK